MTVAKYETAPCPPGAICTPQGREHVVSYEFKVDRSNSPRRPFVVHGEIGGVDLCLDVKVELEVRSEMQHQGGSHHGATPARVSLHPRIDFEPCGSYLRASSWLGARGGVKARQETLHAFHAEIVEAFGGEDRLEAWQNLQDAPLKVTVLGASVEDVREYVNQKLAELGKAVGDSIEPGGHAAHGDHDGHLAAVGSDRRRRGVLQPATRRASATRRAKRSRQTSKSKTPSRAR